MADQELSLLITLKDQATAQLAAMNSEIKNQASMWQSSFGAVQGQLQTAGLMIGGFGAAITGVFGLAYKAEEDTRLETARLSNDLRNIGVSYDSVKDSLNTYIEATMKSTGVSKDQQTAALSQLILTTGNYNQALKLLPVALDLAAAKNMDVTSAAMLLGRVAEGNINALQRYGFSMTGVKDAGTALQEIQNKVAGSAQAMLSPFTELKSQMDALSATIGDLIKGPISSIITQAANVINIVRDWATANPELARTIAEVTLAVGIGAVAVGGMALAVVGFMAALAILGGPITLVLLGVGGLIALGTLMALKWDEVKAHWNDVWVGIITIAGVALGPIGATVAFLIQSAVDIMGAWDTTRSFFDNLWNSIKIIFKDGINDIIAALNIIPATLDWLMGKLGIKQIFGLIPSITSEMMGIYGGSYGAAGGFIGPPLVGALSPNVTAFGNYGGLGTTAVVPGANNQNVTINIEGSVLTNQDLMNAIRQALIQLQYQNGTTGIK